jgi:FMN phosphatase YigB (HAD superfamily)
VSAKVEALLFDLGGVIVEIDWDRAFSRWAADSGARAAGLQAVHVKTPQDVRQALRRANVIPATT